AVGDLLAAAADPDQVVPIAGAFEQLELFVNAAARERIARCVEQRDELATARLRDRQPGDELGERPGIGARARYSIARNREWVARDQHVPPEVLAWQKQAAGEAKGGIEPLPERGLEARDINAELAQQPLGDCAPPCLRRIDRLAAAVADQEAPIDRELVALGVAAEIIMVVEHKDARLRPGAAIEMRGREP